MNIFSSILKINDRIYISSTLPRYYTNTTSNDNNDCRPKTFQLEHVKKRLEATVYFIIIPF